MNPLNYFPKTIDVKDYVSKYDKYLITEGGRNADFILRPVYGKNQFRIAYALYGYEGGIIAYIPFRKEDVELFEDKGISVNPCFGGFIGEDVDTLIKQMEQWLIDNNFMKNE